MIGRHYSRWLAVGVMMLSAFARAQNEPANSRYGPCGAPNGGGPNSTNYYSSGDPCAHIYNVPAERVPQLLTENTFCSLYSRTQVACSKPLNGNYGQLELDRRNGAGAGGGKNPDAVVQRSFPSTPPFIACSNLGDLTNAIRQNPNNADAYVDRAMCYLTPGPNNQKPPLKNTEAAVKDLEAALKLAPRNWIAHHDYAHAAYLLGYDDFAVYEFNKAIALNPKSGRSYMGRGFAYLQMCEFKAAPLDFQQAVNLDPSLRSKVATQQQIDEHHRQCSAQPVAAPTSSRARGIDPYFDHNSDYWHQRNSEERPH
jgi:hypothetical protein